MLWGRKGTQKNQEEHEADGKNDITCDRDQYLTFKIDHPNFGPSIEVLDEHGQDPGPPPDVFITDINGYQVEVRRVSSQEADREEDQGVERHDHYDSEQNQDGPQSTDSGPRQKYTSGGYQGALSPVKESDTASLETSRTQEEKKEMQSREQEELQDFYNNYRNPLARLRARFPEAPAEFLAVGTQILRQTLRLTLLDDDLYFLWHRG
jgi:aquaglyceroporin related protein